jgi:hypothetical protein
LSRAARCRNGSAIAAGPATPAPALSAIGSALSEAASVVMMICGKRISAAAPPKIRPADARRAGS